MSTTRLIIPHAHSLIRPHIKLRFESQTLIFNSVCHLEFSEHKDRSCFLANGGSRRLGGGQRARRARRDDSYTKMGLVVYSSVQPPGAPLPSEPPSNSLKSWILGALITIILPFFRHKWGPLFKLTKEVEAAVESAEHVMEVIEEVTEGVEKVAGEIADELPEGGKLRGTVESVENAAMEAAKDAHLVEEMVDKVEEVEKELESYMEPVNNQASGRAGEANDQKLDKQNPS